MSVNLKGMNILITGASSGIGRQAAITYGKHNANIIALGRSQGALETLDAVSYTHLTLPTIYSV